MKNFVLGYLGRVPAALAHGAAAAILVIVAVTAAHAQQTTVTATWDRNTDTYTAGYRLYYGTASGSYQWSVDAGNQVSARLTLSSGRYFFVLRAYARSLRYGPASSEVSFTVGTTTPAPTSHGRSFVNALDSFCSKSDMDGPTRKNSRRQKAMNTSRRSGTW